MRIVDFNQINNVILFRQFYRTEKKIHLPDFLIKIVSNFGFFVGWGDVSGLKFEV